MKTIRILTALLLVLLLPAAAFCEETLPAETAAPVSPLEGLIFTATVEPCVQTAVKAPAGGELAPFTLRAGDTLKAGDLLMSILPQTVYAPADGTVAAVYAKAGDTADGAMNRYGAVMHIDYTDRYQFSGSNAGSQNTVENRDLHVGTPVYFRSSNKEHFADGIITFADGRNFTAQVLGGDLNYNEKVAVFRTKDYTDDVRLSEGRIAAVAPYGVAASGTLLEMLVKPGDVVCAGDALFTFVPDTLAPAARSLSAATEIRAAEDWVVLSVSAQQGGAVQKGQPVAMVCARDDYRLVINAEEGDVNRFIPGDKMLVTFEELELPAVEATIEQIGVLGSGGEVSLYPVYLTFEVPQGVLLGMHATVEGMAQ